MNGNSPADDRRIDGKISRRDFLKLIFATPFAISLMPLTQLTRAFGSNASNDNVIGPLITSKKKVNSYPMFNSVDKFGIKEFYPTKENGLEWFADWDKDRTVETNSFDPYDHRFGLGSGGGLIIGDGKARIRAFHGAHRLFVKGPWLNTEQTIYIKVLPNGRATSIQLRSRSNHHGTLFLPYPDILNINKGHGNFDIATCGFGNYLVKWGEEQLNFVSIELEIIHALYRRQLLDKPFDIPKDKYIGFKTVTRTLQNGQVKLEGYNNLDVSSQSNWIKTIEFLFDGKNGPVDNQTLTKHQEWLDFCKDKGDKISGDLNNHQIWNKPSYWNWVRINEAENIDLKYYSVREIQ